MTAVGEARDVLRQREIFRLERELARLRCERTLLLRIAGAAACLIDELDADSYYTYESAELLLDHINRAPAELMNEAYALPDGGRRRLGRE